MHSRQNLLKALRGTGKIVDWPIDVFSLQVYIFPLLFGGVFCLSRIISDAEFIRSNAATKWDICNAEDCKNETSLSGTSFGGRGRLTLDQIRRVMASPDYKRPKPLWK